MLTGKKVLVVEDDRHVCEVINATLEMQNMVGEFCHDGLSGLAKASEGNYDLVILDIMLPEKDGLEVCRQLRESGFLHPIVMLTAKVEEVDKILGLELGADDYITKPFSPRELLARCKAVMRRFQHGTQVLESELSFPPLKIKKAQYKVMANQGELDFTPREFELLVFLAEHRGQTMTRDQILDRVWGFDSVSETRTVDEHIKRVRHKLKKAKVKSVSIKTVWGVGYRFEVVTDV